MTLLTPAETAAFLKISMRTLRRLPVPRARIGGQLRYDVADLEAWVRMQKQGRLIDVTPAAVRMNPLPPVLMPIAPPRQVKHRNSLFTIRGKR